MTYLAVYPSPTTKRLVVVDHINADTAADVPAILEKRLGVPLPVIAVFAASAALMLLRGGDRLTTLPPAAVVEIS